MVNWHHNNIGRHKHIYTASRPYHTHQIAQAGGVEAAGPLCPRRGGSSGSHFEQMTEDAVREKVGCLLVHAL